MAAQLSGQFLIFWGWPKRNWPVSETRQSIFLSTLLIFCPVSETEQFSFGRPKKMRNWPRQLVGQRDWPKPHGRPYQVKSLFTNSDAPRWGNVKLNFSKNFECWKIVSFFIMFQIWSHLVARLNKISLHDVNW